MSSADVTVSDDLTVQDSTQQRRKSKNTRDKQLNESVDDVNGLPSTSDKGFRRKATKKNSVIDLGTTQDESDAPLKASSSKAKKRTFAKTPKSNEAASQPALDDSIIEDTKLINGESHIVGSVKCVDQSMNNVTPKKRGRPRKIVLNSVDNEPNGETATAEVSAAATDTLVDNSIKSEVPKRKP